MSVKQRIDPEGGFTMIATMTAMTVIMMLAVVTVAAVNGNTNLTRKDLERKQAYEAAKAGINDYAFHLNRNKNYWAECANVASPNAVNLKGSTAKRRPVPGNTGAVYAIELLPSASQTTYSQCTTSDPKKSMIESSGELPGSFRIRSTGFAGKTKVSIVATFKPPSFLDYLYFTQLETSDPVTYGFPDPSKELTGAYDQCTLLWQDGRYEKPIPNTKTYCNKISFAGGDVIKGPLHTNDAIAINGKPTFGRSSLDMIEVSASEPGWYPNTSGTPNFVGTFVTEATSLDPPDTNESIKNVAQSTFKFNGQVRICLSGTTMKIGNGGSCTTGSKKYSGSIPSNGVVYVAGSCSATYSPYTATYPETSACGNAYVSGEYSGQLTIATENDIIIDGDLTKSGDGLLGLVANNFVRIYHPYCVPPKSGTVTCTDTTAQSKAGDCDGQNGVGTLTNPNIDAAILAINHSFLVDHFDCGGNLGTLSIEGAIAQKFRGPVGTGNGVTVSTGYAKNYVYDDRLRYLEPPSFITPKEQAWVIGRETIDFN